MDISLLRAKTPQRMNALRRQANMRRARLLGTHTTEQWLALLKANDYRCACCDHIYFIDELTKDHIQPVSLGGSDAITNIQPLCLACNSHKGTRVVDFCAARP